MANRNDDARSARTSRHVMPDRAGEGDTVRRGRDRPWTAAVRALVVGAAALPAARHERADAAAQPAGVPAATLREGTLRFDGHATTGDFVGTTRSVTGAVVASADYASVRGEVEAPVATLRTGSGLRDRDLRKTMEVERYPTMRYDLSGAAVQSVAGTDSITLVLHGTLHLHGVSRPVDVPATVVRSADGAEVTGTFPLDLADYQIRELTKMGGLLKMHERIEVHVALRF
jgi:polyisoprenoid-binding protein YceI